MIKYTVNNNAVIAEFSCDNWVDILVKYYIRSTRISNYALADIVYDYMLKMGNDGLKPYGEARCSPDDVFDEEIGKHIARTRLINKYNKVVAGINRELIKLVKSDLRFLKGA